MTQETHTVRVRRSHLVRVVQEYDVEIAVEYDMDEWMANDFGGFDEYVCDMGELKVDRIESVDNDDLDLEVV